MHEIGLDGPETSMIVGKPLEAGGRVLYPVIRISILKSNDDNVNSAWTIPIAVVIEEDSEMFLIRLTDESIDFNEIMELLHTD